MADIPCDDCGKPCGIYVCTGCYDKNLRPGLKKAIKIVQNRQATAKALNCGEEFMEPFKQLLIFLEAELWRAENPDKAKESYTYLDKF